ncbi:MAG: BREX-1 system adenine-specific DNA-methyltransferase PglX [Armatimonadetes bacterium]|nr:BREX-1 system adenine-specific DNA-methyltransferase PglX [Armatimonadota bacterium]
MNPETVNAIHDMTLKARQLLLTEIGEQLEGIYGLLPNGRFMPATGYPALASNQGAAQTRRRLETLLAEEQQAGIAAKQAREKLVKEAAFTWLNRLVAFKMMEAHRLLRQTVTRGQDSNGFKMWLTEPGNEDHLRDYEAGDLPQDGLGEGPRQRAYRHFLLAQCARLAQEVRVLFDPDNLASRLAPRPQALRQMISLLNEEPLQEAWLPGNEETIGWVYQAFNAEELEQAFREVRVSKKKFEASDIPAVTQLFTPRWIVRFLVENTLGRMWLEMHPDSQLGTRLEYLVPSEDRLQAPLKSVREITLLDPACGTMHFGLVAFDLFVEMYREEMFNAGKPGWPENPPLEDESQIPVAIIAHNIHGIDIDLRAVQLSALTLYLKAKTLNPKASLRKSHLACADIHMLDGNRLKDFLGQTGLERRPIYGRVLAALQTRLKDAEQLGSLLHLEKEIRTLVEQERARYEREGRQLDLFGWSNEQFETEAGTREFWERLEVQIGQALDTFARERIVTGKDQSFFAGETTKGLRLLEIMSRRYDVVVTNPPYMSARKMNSTLKRLVSDSYPSGKGDLYAAFIQRCLQFTRYGGRVGMLTMHSFMFISSYENLRSYIRERARITTLVHSGPGLFAVGNPGTLQTAAYVFCREENEQVRNDSVGTYFRLAKEPDGDTKRRRFEQALANLRVGKPDPVVYRYRQGDFDAIPGSPWVYWITPELRRLFITLPKLDKIAQPRQGLATADNFRFLRYWWEAGASGIAFACRNSEEAKQSGKRWFPYMKGGGFRRWYGNQEYIVNWSSDGAEIKKFGIENGRIVSRPQNTDFYFRRGVTWTDLTSGRFSARLSPGGFVFDVSGSSVFPDNIPLVVGVMNSQFAQYALKLINPTVHVQVGDLARLPIPNSSSPLLTELVDTAISLARKDCQEDETTYDFTAPPAWEAGMADVTLRHRTLAQVELRIDEEVYLLYGISDKEREAIEAELAGTTTNEAGDNDNGDSEPGEEDLDTAQEVPLTREELARRWISYAVGIVMGRFQPGVEGALGRGSFAEDVAAKLRDLADSDGVLVLDPGHPDDLPTKVLQALRIMLGDEAAAGVVFTGTGRPGNPEEELRRYFERSFFKEHIQKYRKRPVYWLLQSPRKTYGVWLFHEKLTGDTLYRIRGEQYVGSKINLLESQLADLRERRRHSEGRERRSLENQMAGLEEILDDIREFARRIDAVLQRGYTPHLDDGVLINMAPLWELLPSWQAEPKKCWQALERGDYDWSHQAMEYWHGRVREKCKTNKSYAIAHGLVE